ncbi:hypothetical protein GQ43DRAFT_482342 [Delitschia confertaspora ATCC 74209]|uniref:Uncharacterized protein n=1 Tax=Delitschia confertaspora ATCC 74209 TaxID=1513339 RepID=A0A9P4MR38_9PLEO|nr:hypothetical protein GQ43DRAFT_482342 [Delitschia confertaspora ATCC 74209]
MNASRWAPKPPVEDPPPPATGHLSPHAETSQPAEQQLTKPAPGGDASEPTSSIHIEEPAPVEPSTAPSYDYDNMAPYDYNTMEGFAQTASTDDLFFDDDIIPVAEPVVEQATVELPEPEPPLAASEKSPSTTIRTSNGHREPRGGNRGRGRGGRRGGAHSGREQTAPTDNTQAESATTTSAEADSAAPTTPKLVPSVRGDRTLTGGNARTRLTDAELEARIASIKSKNSSREAAHARAERDAANFEAREALAAQLSEEKKRQNAEKMRERQRAERQNRQQMMGERERNRLRKLEAVKGREWDFEKEEGFSGTGEERRRGAARGAYGGVVSSPKPSAGAPDEAPRQGEDVDSPPPAQRGGYRGRGNRGSRGGRGGSQRVEPGKPQNPPTEADFPDLPAPTSAASKDVGIPKELAFPIRTKGTGVEKEEQGSGEKKSWADQVEGI